MYYNTFISIEVKTCYYLFCLNHMFLLNIWLFSRLYTFNQTWPGDCLWISSWNNLKVHKIYLEYKSLHRSVRKLIAPSSMFY